MYIIMGQYQGRDAEEIDTAYNEESANALVTEYKSVLSNHWHIWVNLV